ncbi:MAG TPA: sigma-70 family RNA polymerase sigma factor [Sandaracinaceae bacterium]
MENEREEAERRGASGPDALWAEEQPRLRALAYRMLGSLAEAEDVVQEAYARAYRLSPEQRAAVRSPRAWLTAVTSRLCLDALGSARARRERYVGTWLPEPWPGDELAQAPADDPASMLALAESASMALLVVLESMTPAQRVVFVLHDVFQYSFDEVAEMVGRTPEACRKLASAARARVSASRLAGRRPADGATLRAFRAAWQARDLEALIELLDPEAVAIADGGGVVRAALAPVRGPRAIAETLVRVFERHPGLTLAEHLVNARPGLVAKDRDGSVLAVVGVGSSERGAIDRLWIVRNPFKLRAW